MAAVLVGVVQLLGCAFDGAWCLVCVSRRHLLSVVCVDCRRSLSFMFLRGSRCLGFSPCNTHIVVRLPNAVLATIGVRSSAWLLPSLLTLCWNA